MPPRFSIITERPEDGASAEQLERLHQRYAFALPYSKGKRVLELACGAGIGLGMLATVAVDVVGGDFDLENVKSAQEVAQKYSNVTAQFMDAQEITYPDSSFDVVLLYEAIYYIPDLKKMLVEVNRVLAPGATFIIVSANRLWTDFNPSKYSVSYYSKAELYELLTKAGFSVSLFKSYDVTDSDQASFVSTIKRWAVRLGLIPKSMFFKQFLKRMFMGELVRLPDDLVALDIPYHAPIPVSADDLNNQFKVIFAVGAKSSDSI